VSVVASWDDVRRIALGLPETSERTGRGSMQWWVKDRMFVWERPLGKADLTALGDAAPDGPIVATRVADVGVRAALIADEPGVYFTIPHFDGYAAILVRLDIISVPELDELIVESWLLRAPKRVAEKYLAR
jgi:hypothetical protein